MSDFRKEAIDGKFPPEPPKDENGNPIAPPDGFKPPFGGKFPGEPPKDEDGNPIAPPESFKQTRGGHPPKPDFKGEI